MHGAPLHRWLILTALVVILAVTLIPIAGGASESWRSCIVCGDRWAADVLVNVVLFLPLGAALAAAGVPPARCVLAGALLSALIELAQVFVPGRDASAGDVASNTVGTALGVALVATASFWLRPTSTRAGRLSNAAAVMAVAMCYAIGLLLTPALPPSRYFSLWTPSIAPLQWYRGRVRAAKIGDMPIPAGPIAYSAAMREYLDSSRNVVLLVRAIAGPRPSALAPLLAINDERGREILLLGADRDDVVFRFRTRAVTWHLDQPDLRLENALRGVVPGDTLAVAVRGNRGRYDMAVNSAAAAGLGLTVGSGWSILLYPEVFSASLKALLGLVWVAALFVPAGFWARTRRDAWVIVAALAAGLLGAPAVTPLGDTPLLQWIAAGMGTVAGACARLAISRVGTQAPPRPQVD